MVKSDPQHTESSNFAEARMCNHKNNMSFWLSPQWLCGNSCTWAHDVQCNCIIEYIFFDKIRLDRRSFPINLLHVSIVIL